MARMKTVHIVAIRPLCLRVFLGAASCGRRLGAGERGVLLSVGCMEVDIEMWVRGENLFGRGLFADCRVGEAFGRHFIAVIDVSSVYDDVPFHQPSHYVP